MRCLDASGIIPTTGGDGSDQLNRCQPQGKRCLPGGHNTDTRYRKTQVIDESNNSAEFSPHPAETSISKLKSFFKILQFGFVLPFDSNALVNASSSLAHNLNTFSSDSLTFFRLFCYHCCYHRYSVNFIAVTPQLRHSFTIHSNYCKASRFSQGSMLYPALHNH